MIDFRYHLVSIVAVFLALAVGIVIGASALQPEVLKVLHKASEVDSQKISSQRSEISELQNQNSADQMFAAAAAPRLLDNLLAGQQVVIVTAPGADGSTISGVTSALKQAGAKVTGEAELQPAFFDTSASTETSLDALAQKLTPPGVTPGSQTVQFGGSAQIAGQQEAAQVIAAALVTQPGADLPTQQIQNILDGFAQQGFLQLSQASGAATLAQATLAVVIIPANPPPAGDSDPANLTLLALAEQLKLAGRGVVLAGSLPGSGPGSAIDELVNGSTGIQVSSVDDANTEVGQIQVVQALSYLLAGHKPAAYGVYAGAVPSPAPTPSATPTPTPTSSPTRKGSG